MRLKDTEDTESKYTDFVAVKMLRGEGESFRCLGGKVKVEWGRHK